MVRQICPECRSGHIYQRTTLPAEVRWRCRDCEARFETPDSGEIEEGQSLRGKARLLDEMDPDDI